MSYSNLRKMVVGMKKDAEDFKNRGAVAQFGLLNEDIKTVEDYILQRLESFEDEAKVAKVSEFENEHEEDVVENFEEEHEKEFEEEIDTPEEAIEEAKVEEIAEIEEIVEIAVEEAKVEEAKVEAENGNNKIEYTNESAAKMKESGMTWKEVGEYFGLAGSTVSSRVKKHLEELKA